MLSKKTFCQEGENYRLSGEPLFQDFFGDGGCDVGALTRTFGQNCYDDFRFVRRRKKRNPRMRQVFFSSMLRSSSFAGNFNLLTLCLKPEKWPGNSARTTRFNHPFLNQRDCSSA